MEEESLLEAKVNLVVNLQAGNLEKALQNAQSLLATESTARGRNSTVKEMIR